MNQTRRSGRGTRTFDWRYWPEPDPQSPARASNPWQDEFINSPPDAFPTVPESAWSHPELEQETLLAWGLANSDDGRGTTTLDICCVRNKQVEWHENVDDKELKSLIDRFSGNDDNKEDIYLVFFLNTKDASASWLPGNFSIRPTTLRILLQAGLSKVILGDIFTYEGSFIKMGPQCFEWWDTNGSLSRFEVCYRSRTGWDASVEYMQSIRTASRTTYFCINYPSSALHRFKKSLRPSPDVIRREFYLEMLAVADSIRAWRWTIGLKRTQLLQHESVFADHSKDYYALTRDLHRLARNWNTLNQDCSDYISTLEFLQRAHGKYRKAVERSTWTVEKNTNTQEYFDVLKAQGENCLRWTSVYRDRTNIRINLLFHLSNQREALTSKKIALSTASVAELTQRDSSSMITMAAVTMLFLPGTFIATVLSTTFFDHGKDALDVSRTWWILPAATIPTTIVVFGVWWAWRRWRLEAQRSVMKKYVVVDDGEEEGVGKGK